MITIPVIEGQSLFDVALQEYGSIEHVFKIIKDNPGITINSNIGAGVTLKIDTSFVSNEEAIKAVFQANKSKDIYPVNLTDKSSGDFSEDFNNDFNI